MAGQRPVTRLAMCRTVQSPQLKESVSMTSKHAIDDDLISEYTDEMAIDDGVLFHPYPQRWPFLLISINVNEACSRGENGRTRDQCLTPLCMDAILAAQSAQAKSRRGIAIRLPLVLKNTIAGTVWIRPNSSGGLTICQPEED
jgi:hypothetical protein